MALDTMNPKQLVDAANKWHHYCMNRAWVRTGSIDIRQLANNRLVKGIEIFGDELFREWKTERVFQEIDEEIADMRNYFLRIVLDSEGLLK